MKSLTIEQAKERLAKAGDLARKYSQSLTKDGLACHPVETVIIGGEEFQVHDFSWMEFHGVKILISVAPKEAYKEG